MLDGSSQTILIGEKLVTRLDLGWLSGTRATLRNTGTPINSSSTGLLAAIDDGASVPGRIRCLRTAPNVKPALVVGGFESHHPAGANFLFADGSARFIGQSINQKTLQQLGHRADGQLLDDRGGF